jgi:hypothetical protein
MRRWLILFFISVSCFMLFPSVAGCARGESVPRRRDAGVRVSVDAAHPPMPRIDAATPRVDAYVPRTPLRETCNGTDDDLDVRVDEDFLCPLGRMGEICVTSCGVNGYRLCEAPTCSWSATCHTFDEICGDTLDNDCDGHIDEDCAANPGSGSVCDEGMARIHLETNSHLGTCAEGWTLVLWGASGMSEMYLSSPGDALDVAIRDDWLGWSAVTAYCGDWEGIRRWEFFEGSDAASAGISVSIDGVSVPVQVCYDPGGDIVRPLVPVQCGLPACPGRTY